MTITPETVQHVANLARLELTDDETERFTQDLGKILDLVAQLETADLSGIDVALTVTEPTVFRSDVGVREFSRETLMQNAPETEDGFFRVPRILSD